MRPNRRADRGTSLIELMIAMAVLTIGLLAMWRLHVVGITANAAARRHTVATALAQELVSGLERLRFDDARLEPDYKGSSLPASVLFGPLVDGSGDVKSGAKDFDVTPVSGVRAAADMREASEVSAAYKRRWTVWGYCAPGAPDCSSPGVKIIAVSVVWFDPPFARPREVVLYTQVYDPAAFTANLTEGS